MAQTGPFVFSASPVVSNPTDGTIMCDSGALSRGPWLFGITGETDVSLVYRVVLVNAGTELTRRRPAAGDIDWLQPSQEQINQNEIVRVLIVGAPLANVQMTLWGVLI